MALIMTVYNLKRAINILGMEELLVKLKACKPDYKKVSRFAKIRLILRRHKGVLFFTPGKGSLKIAKPKGL